MFDDPVTPIRRRFPTGPTWNLPEPPADAPTIPFAVRYGVPPEVVTYAKHERPPTRTKDEGLQPYTTQWRREGATASAG